MRKTSKILALTLGSVMVLSSLAVLGACGGKTEPAVAARICYDNLPDDGIEIPADQTSIELKGYDTVKETNAAGEEVAAGVVATYENGVLTAKSAGTVILSKGDKSFRVEVVPAYVTNPNNQYTPNRGSDFTQGSKLLGGTHDPSLIEVEENGKPAYYIFSTGWATGNEIRRSEDLIHWEYKGKATAVTTPMPLIDLWEEEKNVSLAPDGAPGIQWWAPDIVPAYGGGYWLYTCCVSHLAHNTDGSEYSKACIVLFHSMSLTPGSFTYQGVLMQSAIPQRTADSSYDVNSIDPQIIYSPDGKMYMAYGSFGTGNWMLELNPKTGLRKDKMYESGEFKDIATIREYRNEAVDMYMDFAKNQGATKDTLIKHPFYGTMISLNFMEAPVIARHDGVTVSDETGKVYAKNKTYYYSSHSYNGLDSAYQMWGGRSESVWGIYRSTNGGIVYNVGVGDKNNSGNKYMGTFKWQDADKNTSIDIRLPGHNDYFTTKDGVNVAAYITRTDTYQQNNVTQDIVFVSQIHQYYLNSMGDLVINPNRYGGESGRAVTQAELFKYTQDGKFKMVALKNDNNLAATSVDVTLTEDGKISDATSELGTWQMYGNGYIVLRFKEGFEPTPGQNLYYGVVRTAWLDDQNKSGFTITCMSHPEEGAQSYALFMNNYSTLTGTGLVG